jgi:signal transduction histidine kinase
MIFLGDRASQAGRGLVKANAELGQLNRDLAVANKELLASNEELTRLNDAVKEANLELNKLSEQKDRFLSTLSHELRNPLAPIVMSATILQRSNWPDKVSSDALRVLIRQTSHMKALLDDLLDKRRIASGSSN